MWEVTAGGAEREAGSETETERKPERAVFARAS